MTSPARDRSLPATHAESEPQGDQFHRDNHKSASDLESIDTNEEVVEDNDRPDSSDLMFEKKHVHKSRTQSIQSVLSTASLKSLSAGNMPNGNQPRRNSIINTPSNYNNTKNFQSFIQAPVLSSITDLKNNDDIEIGQRLPFVDRKEDESDQHGSSSKVTSDEDDEGLWQQQKLTINALKKLSLSPQPIYNTDDPDSSTSTSRTPSTVVRKTSAAKIPVLEKIVEPYQPAEVDLSTFSSLTRQPKIEKNASLGEPAEEQQRKSSNNAKREDEKVDIQRHYDRESDKEKSLAVSDVQKSIEGSMSMESRLDTSFSQPSGPFLNSSTASNSAGATIGSQTTLNNQTTVLLAQAAYHKELQETHQLRNMRPGNFNNKIPAAVIPPQDMNIRRTLLLHFIGGKVNGNGNGILIEGKSPTRENHHQAKQLQQIKGFRNPMYVPAVLRMSGLNKNGPNGYSIDTNELVRDTDNLEDSQGRVTLNGNLSSKSGNNSGSNSSNFNNKTSSNNRNANSEDTATTTTVSSNNNNNNNTNNNDDNNNNESDENRTSKKANADLTNSGGKSIQSSQSSLTSVESSESMVNSMSSPRLSSKNKKVETISKLAPTRRHWLKDEAVTKCGIRSCNKHFNFFERRHHCRKCGGIYCNEHTSHYLYINHLAQFTTGGRGTLSKVCDYCIGEYNEFIKNEFGVDVHSTGNRTARKVKSSLPLLPLKRDAKPNRLPSDGTSTATSIYNGTMVDKLGPMSPGIAPVKKDGARSEQLVGSVPANWSWSSF